MDPAFEFDLTSIDRSALLAEAERKIHALDIELGPAAGTRGTGADADPTVSALLNELNSEIARFGAHPEVLPFTEASFAEYGWPIPKGFSNLKDRYRFFWTRFPLDLSPAGDSPFNKLECVIEFSPEQADGKLRPRAHLILPDRKFKELLAVNSEVELNVEGKVDFGGATPQINLQYGIARVNAGGTVDTSASGKVNVKAGPFNLSVRRAEIDHGPAGTEKVRWRLSGSRFIHEDDPSFIVVLQVPNEVEVVPVAAALQAYHEPNFGLPVQRALNYLAHHIASFFRAGAPIQATKTWPNIL